VLGHEVAVVLDRPGTGEQEARFRRPSLVERYGPEVIEPVQDPAAEPLVVAVVPWIVEQLHLMDLPPHRSHDNGAGPPTGP
jgi:hypothetical protein